MKETLRHDNEELHRLVDVYREDPSVKNCNAIKHAAQCLSLKLLAEKATEGSTMAVIALNATNLMKPTINTFYDLANASALSKDDMQVSLAQIRMKLKNRNINEFSIVGVQDAYAEHMITRHEFDEAMAMLIMSKNATLPKTISGEIKVVLNAEADDALYADD